MQKEEHFERYTPQYPLPTDITNLSRQDTVCQFCGVSYLIHNEIKALETKCQKLEADLVYYAGMSSREATLEDKLQNERTKVSDLETTLNINTHKINELIRRLQLVQDQCEQAEKAHRETKASFTLYSSNLRLIISQIRKDYFFLQDFYSKNSLNWKQYLQTTENALQKEIQSTINHHRFEIDQYNLQLKELKQTLENLQQSQFESKESHLHIQNDLEAAREEIKLHQNELSYLREQLSHSEQVRMHLQIDFEQNKQNFQKLEQQITNEKELRLRTENELEVIRSKLLHLTNEYEQLTTTKREIEMNEFNSRRKNDEINRTRQAVLDRTRDEYEKLLRKYTDLDEIYRELIEQRDKETSELKVFRSELERLHNENIELNKQRETLIITHDIQIKKLHDSYSTKLHEAEQWPDRLQKELNHQREQHRLAMHELERQLKESFLTELNIEKQKSTDLVRKYEHDTDYSTKQLRQELISTEKVTIEQRQYYTKQIQQLENDKEYFKVELNQLRNVLKDLHEQLTKQNQNQGDNHLQLKEDLIKKEKCLFQAETLVEQLQKELEQTRDEITTLQETVHKECTEREQLKDALIDARQQLLTLKKNGVLNGTASRSLHSPPIAFEEIEKRVQAPLPYSSSNQTRHKIPSFVRSEPTVRDSSLHDDAADLMARPFSSMKEIPYRSKPLPPIIHSQQQQQQKPTRRNGNSLASNRSSHLLENQRRITRFIKHIK